MGKSLTRLQRHDLVVALYEAKQTVAQICERTTLGPSFVYQILRAAGVNKQGAHVDLKGKKFGLLTVSCLLRKSEKGTVWMCWCYCGNSVERTGVVLRRGRTVHCRKCKVSKARLAELRLTTQKEWPKQNSSKTTFLVGEITVSLWRRIKSCAWTRSIEFQVTPEESWQLFISQGRTCWFTGDIITLPSSARSDSQATASLDRLDSSLGYTISNVRWIHKDLQRMKNAMSPSVFIATCAKVTAHSISKAV